MQKGILKKGNKQQFGIDMWEEISLCKTHVARIGLTQTCI
jgi:hypothetical protein